MSDWNSVKAMYRSSRQMLDNAITDDKITNMVNTMNQNISNYTNRAGISQSSDSSTEDPSYRSANNEFQSIQNYQNTYVTINSYLSKKLKGFSGSADIEGKLKVVGQLQEDVKKLNKELENAKQDSDTSKTRQNTIETSHTKVSWYQGFGANLGFVKPLHQVSIPFLLGFGVLFLFLSALILREFFVPDMSSSTNGTVDGGSSIFGIFTDSRFLAVTGGMTFVIAVLFVLSLSGYLGKNAR